MRAVDAVMECLKAEEVEVIFGLPGGANLPTYDALYDAGIRHVLVRHELPPLVEARRILRPGAGRNHWRRHNRNWNDEQQHWVDERNDQR